MHARDPLLKPYRAALWAAYFFVLLAGIGLFSLSIVRNLRGPRRPPREEGPLPTRAALRVCFADLENLYREQNARAWGLGTEFDGPDSLSRWNTWAREWERKVDDLADRCRLDGASGEDAAARSELAAARDALLALHRAYATQVNRFAQEQGELAQGAAEALAHARDEVFRAR
ncbi:MAG TPA: hypothetical protein VMK12_15100 [Anaeromyxobacteraceae bacterium]|nr:hypothetical protein [Anaeromyxobacteraceae bacterium]